MTLFVLRHWAGVGCVRTPTFFCFFFVDTSLPDGSSRFEPGWSGFHRPVPGFIDIELAPSLIEFYWVYRVKLCFT